jgi:hypothetical protein
MIGSCAFATEAGINTKSATSTPTIFLIPHCGSFYSQVVITQRSRSIPAKLAIIAMFISNRNKSSCRKYWATRTVLRKLNQLGIGIALANTGKG